MSSNSQVKSEVYSYLARELRSLGDVTIVESGGQYTLIILIDEIDTDGNMAMTSLFGKEAVCNYTFPNQKTERCTALSIFKSLSTLQPTELKERIAGVVTQFDTAILEKDRKIFNGK